MHKDIYVKKYRIEKEYTSSLTFDGVNDYINIPHNTKFNLTGDLTIEGWISISTFKDFHIIAAKQLGNGTTNQTFQIFINSLGVMVFTQRDSMGNYNDVSSPSAVPLNTFFHFAVVRSGINRLMYINGLLVANTVGTSNPINTNTQPVRIGGRDDLLYFLGGRIQEIKIWNTARTTIQIRDNMFRRLTGSETGLVGYYRLNEGTGTTAIDSSASPQNGTLTNFPANPWSTSNIAPITKRSYKGIEEYQFDSVTSNINGGYTDISFRIPRRFDNFGLNVTTGMKGYETDVVIYDQESPLGKTIFSGEDMVVDRQLDDTERVQINSTSPFLRLEKTPLLTSANSHIVSYSSVDVGVMFRNVIDSYNSQQFYNQIRYTTTTLPTIGVSRTINFNNVTCLDALQSIYKLTPDSWFWFLDVDRTIYLKQISSTINHRFFLGKDIIAINATESKLDLNNAVAFWDGASVAREYRDNTSIDDYGLFFDRRRDGRFTNTASMDSWGQKEVSDNKDPNTQVVIKVVDSAAGGYDLESINVGDTCKILNIEASSGLTNDMIITKKEDYLDYAVLTIADKNLFTSRELYNLKKAQQQSNYVSGPSSYTLV